eukprot:jgi/Undpi1/10180/HiC_scaffold_28.g12633.m1
MGPQRREMTAVVGGETTSLLNAPRTAAAAAAAAAEAHEDPFSRAFETGGGRGGSSEDGAGDMPRYDLHSYHAQPSSAYQPALPPPERRKTNNAKTRFPSLTPAPGPFLQSGDTRAAEAVAHARKTWAPPALRTQAVTSYGAVPDLEVIPEDTEVRRFQVPQGVRRYADLGCPACTIS